METATYTVTETNNATHPVGSAYTSSADDATTAQRDPDLKARLKNGRIVLSGPYAFTLGTASGNATALGFDLSGGALTSGLLYAVQADQPGSTVSLGAPAGPNGKLYIAGKVLSYNSIQLFSGTSPDGVDVDLDATGVLQTLNGPISFAAGVNANVQGSVLAAGIDSDVVLSAL